jgi:signal transduction histidine kinase
MSGDSESDLRLLQDVAVIANQAGSMEEAFLRTMRRVTDFNGWTVGFAYWVSAPGRLEPSRLWYSAREDSAAEAALREHLEATPLASGEELPGRALEADEHRCIADVRDEEAGTPQVVLARAAGLRGAIAYLVRSGDEAVAVIQHFAIDSIAPDDTLVETLAYVGTQLGRSVERERSERRLSDLAAREQHRIGEELHDGLGQQLTGLSLLARNLTRTLASQGSPAEALATELESGLETARHQARTLAKGLLMLRLDDRSLVEALEEIAEEICADGEVVCRVEADRSLEIADHRLAVTLFRIAREALANALRHAEAETLVVRLARTGAGEIVLEVEDDGKGLPPDADPGRESAAGEGGLGLRIVRDRAAQVGGELEIDSGPGEGTRVRVTAREGGGRVFT